MDQRCLPSQIAEYDVPQSFDGGERREARAQRLENIIWSEIVPRLANLHHGARASAQWNPPSAEEIEEFGRIVIAGDGAKAAAFFAKIRARGHSIETLFENLLAPTARHLGELWQEDRCDFLDVTVGIGRLQELLDEFGRAEGAERGERERRVLLVATPHEAHVFGLKLVGKLMLSAGWDVRLHDRFALQANVDVVAQEWVAVVGVTMGTLAVLSDVARTITALRRASFNPSITVFVGGGAFNDAPELVARVGADSLAEDGPSAVMLAERSLQRQLAVGRGRAKSARRLSEPFRTSSDCAGRACPSETRDAPAPRRCA